MKWIDFLNIVQELPVIDTSLFNGHKWQSKALAVQIVGWEKANKLIKLRRGLYLLAPQYRKIEVNPYYLAAVIKWPSYLSLESALQFYGIIPEGVPTITSVTTKRPGRFSSEEGIYDYRNIKSDFFWGYKSFSKENLTSHIALPEKAILDLFHIRKVPTSNEYIEELRLQNLDILNQKLLKEMAKKFKRPKILRVANLVCEKIKDYKHEMKVL